MTDPVVLRSRVAIASVLRQMYPHLDVEIVPPDRNGRDTVARSRDDVGTGSDLDALVPAAATLLDPDRTDGGG